MAKIRQSIVITSLIASFFFALVFVYRAKVGSHAAYVSEHATMFPAARAIKPFKLMMKEEKVFSQENLKGHWTLLFFGFTHCASVCPVTLDMLSKAYDELHAFRSNLRVVFVSLDPARDNLFELQSYAKKYHPSFIGLTGKIQELHKLQAELHVYSAKEVSPPKDNENYQIQHTSSLLLINPQGKWAGLFNYGMRPKEFIREFKKALS